MRVFEEKIYRGLKAATSGLVDAFGVLKQAEAASRVSLQMLATYYNQGQSHVQTFMPIDVMIDLMKKSGDLSLLEYIASIFNKKLVDDVRGHADLLPVEKSMIAITAMSEASAVLAKAASDGEITPDEAKEGLRKLSEAAQANADAQETLTAVITQ